MYNGEKKSDGHLSAGTTHWEFGCEEDGIRGAVAGRANGPDPLGGNLKRDRLKNLTQGRTGGRVETLEKAPNMKRTLLNIGEEILACSGELPIVRGQARKTKGGE